MSELKMKIEHATEDVCEIFDALTKAMMHQVDNGVENLDAEEAYKCIDMIKDLADAKKNIVKAMYYEQIMCAMEESEYGKEYDENGELRYYPRTMMPRKRAYSMPVETYKAYTPQELRDMDRESNKVMYYTPTDNGSRYETARRAYTDNKHGMNDESGNLKAIEKIMNVLSTDLKEMMPEMTSAEKTYIKQKMMNMSNDVK